MTAPALIRCTRCGEDATGTSILRPHEARYAAAHATDGAFLGYVCAKGHRLLLRVPRAEDATKPTEVALATSIARAGLVR